MLKSRFILKLIISFALFVANPSMVRAAVVYLDPSAGTLNSGDVFVVRVKIDNQSECLNTVEVKLDFSTENLELVDFTIGESFLNIWVNKPERIALSDINIQGSFSFAGGVPGGYCGKLAGDPGDSNILASLVFRAKKIETSDETSRTAKINLLPGTTAYINDGLGTVAEMAIKGAEFSISSTTTELKQEWQQQINQDKVSPESFIVELNQNQALYDGKFFIVFNTADKQTGIDHYEILETSVVEPANRTLWYKIKKIFTQPIPDAWVVANMPYVLFDQSLESRIQIKAIDKAGNQRITEYMPTEEQRAFASSYVFKKNHGYLAGAVLTFFVIIAIIWLVAKRMSKKDN